MHSIIMGVHREVDIEYGGVSYTILRTAGSGLASLDGFSGWVVRTIGVFVFRTPAYSRS